MDKRQKSDHELVRRARANSNDEKKAIGIVEDEDFAIATGRKNSTGSGSAVDRNSLARSNISNISLARTSKSLSLSSKSPSQTSKSPFPSSKSPSQPSANDKNTRLPNKLNKKDSRKVHKLLKILKADLKEKKSTKLHLLDALEKMFRKFTGRSKSLKSGASNSK